MPGAIWGLLTGSALLIGAAEGYFALLPQGLMAATHKLAGFTAVRRLLAVFLLSHWSP